MARCLFCGKSISRLQRWTQEASAEFYCSNEHRDRYQELQAQAVDWLMTRRLNPQKRIDPHVRPETLKAVPVVFDARPPDPAPAQEPPPLPALTAVVASPTPTPEPDPPQMSWVRDPIPKVDFAPEQPASPEELPVQTRPMWGLWRKRVKASQVLYWGEAIELARPQPEPCQLAPLSPFVAPAEEVRPISEIPMLPRTLASECPELAPAPARMVALPRIESETPESWRTWDGIDAISPARDVPYPRLTCATQWEPPPCEEPYPGCLVDRLMSAPEAPRARDAMITRSLRPVVSRRVIPIRESVPGRQIPALKPIPLPIAKPEGAPLFRTRLVAVNRMAAVC